MNEKNTIRLFEHEFITYTEAKLKPFSPVIDFLEELNENGRELLSLTQKGLRAKQMVGLIQVKDLSIEILPKMYREGLAEAEQINNAQRNLLYLLHYCYDIPIYESEIAHMQARKSNWFEILTFIFTKNLMDIFKKGAHKQYIPIEENLSVFKGKWMIQKHFRVNPFQKHRFYMNYDEFSPDIPINQILRYVTNKLKFQSHDQENRKNLRILDQQMEEITLLHDPIRILNNVVFTWLNENYRPVFNLAKLFIEGNVVETSAGSSGAFAFTFDMNLLFERFIARFIKENMDAVLPESLRNCNIHMQSNRKAFAKNLDRKNVFYLKPDIIFKEGDSVKLIIDTKYKVLNKTDRKFGVSIFDMYQMAAYASRYECSNVILLYPRTADVNESVLEKYELEKIDCTIKIATVDLRIDLIDSYNKRKLIKDINGILQKEV